MKHSEIYDYLMRARRELWRVLETVPEEVLAKPMLVGGDRFRCIQDLLFHLAEVEDGWIHGDIQRIPMLQHSWPAIDPNSLPSLLDYWRGVEQDTLAYLAKLDDAELQRAVEVETGKRHTVDGLLWHVMIHEMRHTSQICALLRTQGIQPPALDLFWYLPNV